MSRGSRDIPLHAPSVTSRESSTSLGMTTLAPFSAVIPCYNEAARIGETLRLTVDYLAGNAPEAELIVVNDGSTDETSAIARENLANAQIATRLLENFPNRGKGAAVRKGLIAAQKPIGLFFDADLSTPLEEIPKLIEPIATGTIDIAFGSRALDRRLIGVHQPWSASKVAACSIFVRIATGLPFWDTQCGFKAFRLDVCRPILEAARTPGFRFRCGAALSRPSGWTASARDSRSLESRRRQQDPFFARQPKMLREVMALRLSGHPERM